MPDCTGTLLVAQKQTHTSNTPVTKILCSALSTNGCFPPCTLAHINGVCRAEGCGKAITTNLLICKNSAGVWVHYECVSKSIRMEVPYMLPDNCLCCENPINDNDFDISNICGQQYKVHYLLIHFISERCTSGPQIQMHEQR